MFIRGFQHIESSVCVNNDASSLPPDHHGVGRGQHRPEDAAGL